MPRLPALLALLLAATAAHAVAPSVVDISPAGGSRGTTATITFVGDRLENPLEVLAHEPGIAIKELIAESPQRVRATVVIAIAMLEEGRIPGIYFEVDWFSGVCRPKVVALQPQSYFERNVVVPFVLLPLGNFWTK